jgi:C-terminal processing protease CtpA/Prc
LVKIGGKPISAMTQAEMGQKITGEAGTSVVLVVQRGSKELKFDVERQILY